MSRINTQDGRLARGGQSLDSQRSFLVQARRFTPAGSSLEGLARAAGQVSVGLIAQRERDAAKQDRISAENRKAVFNQTLSGLMESKQILDNTDTGDEDEYSLALKDMYDRLAEAEAEFPESTDEGVQIRRAFGGVEGLDLFEENRVRLAEEARRGAFFEGAEQRLQYYDTAESKSTMAEVSTATAQGRIFLDLASGWDTDVLGEMTDTDRDELMRIALTGANKTATERATRIRNEEKEISTAASRSASVLVKNGLASYQDVQAMASASGTRREEMDLKVAKLLAQDIVSMVDSGEDVEKLSSRVANARAFGESSGSPAVVDEINKALADYYAISATQDVTVLNVVGRDHYTSGANLDELMKVLNRSGVEMFETRFGRDSGAERIEDIIPKNDLEKGYLTEMNQKFGDINSKEEVKIEAAEQAVHTIEDPGNSSGSEITAFLNLKQEDRARVMALVEGDTELLTSSKDDLVIDNAKWAEFSGDVLRDQTGYRQGFQKYVIDPLDGDNPSHDELRGALGYAGIDPADSARHFDNTRTQYAFAEVQREVMAQWNLVPEGPPPEDFVLSGLMLEDLTTIYKRGLDEYDSFRITVGGEGVPLSGIFDNKDFVKELTGDRNASIPKSVRDKFISLVDITSIKDGTSPRAVAAHVIQMGNELGLYFTTTQDNSSRRIASVMSNRNSPEGIGLSRKKFQKVLNSSSSTATRYIGTLLNKYYQLPGSPDFHDIAIEAISRNSSILPDAYKGVLTRSELEGLVRQQRVFFDVLPQVGNISQGSPVLMYMKTNQGNYVTLPLGFIDFTGPTGLKNASEIQSKTFYQEKRNPAENKVLPSTQYYTAII